MKTEQKVISLVTLKGIDWLIKYSKNIEQNKRDKVKNLLKLWGGVIIFLEV